MELFKVFNIIYIILLLIFISLSPFDMVHVWLFTVLFWGVSEKNFN